jgi:glucosyl-3-phosphoglycerate synthase
MRPDVQRWFGRRTYDARTFSPHELGVRKTQTVSVVLPALNEVATVGSIVSTIRRELVEDAPLVDEIVVIDPGSTDGTAEAAAQAGAKVVAEADILPEHGRIAGKGEALWKSLHVAKGDLIVFVDADLEDFDSRIVTGLLGPLIMFPEVSYVKASYERPLARGLLPGGAGRVTELVARPLLSIHWPALTGLIQPLAGEYAGRREMFERLPFVSGYGVEFALLVDSLNLVGLDAIAQVEVGRKVHRHQDDEGLGRMSVEIMRTALRRLETADSPTETALVQFRRGPDGVTPVTSTIHVAERPPLVTIKEYAEGDPRTTYVTD